MPKSIIGNFSWKIQSCIVVFEAVVTHTVAVCAHVTLLSVVYFASSKSDQHAPCTLGARSHSYYKSQGVYRGSDKGFASLLKNNDKCLTLTLSAVSTTAKFGTASANN